MTGAGWDLGEAIAAATGVLGMLELPTEDVPPQHIWHHQDRLEEWFAAVRQRRKDAIKGVEAVPQADEDEPGTEYLTNELTKGLRD